MTRREAPLQVYELPELNEALLQFVADHLGNCAGVFLKSRRVEDWPDDVHVCFTCAVTRDDEFETPTVSCRCCSDQFTFSLRRGD